MHNIDNFTTNLAEGWMHIRSKFDGGKHINRSQGGVWRGRCAGAALRHNIGPDWGARAWEEITGSTANATYVSVSENRCKLVEADRKRKATDKAKESRWQSKSKRSCDDSNRARDYSRHDGGIAVLDVVSDVPKNNTGGSDDELL